MPPRLTRAWVTTTGPTRAGRGRGPGALVHRAGGGAGLAPPGRRGAAAAQGLDVAAPTKGCRTAPRGRPAGLFIDDRSASAKRPGAFCRITLEPIAKEELRKEEVLINQPEIVSKVTLFQGPSERPFPNPAHGDAEGY